MLSAADLTAMQVTLDASLPDTATVYRVARTSDDAGGYTDAWAAAGSAVACRISPVSSGRELAVAAKLTSVSPWVLTLPAGTNVTTADQLRTSTRTFEVLAPLAPRSWEISRRVICEEIA
jgi:hypothetical protein